MLPAVETLAEVESFDGDVSQPLGSPEYRRTRPLLSEMKPTPDLQSNTLSNNEGFVGREKLPEPFRLSDVTPNLNCVHPDMYGMAENLHLAIHGFRNTSEPPSSLASTPFAEATNVAPHDRTPSSKHRALARKRHLTQTGVWLQGHTHAKIPGADSGPAGELDPSC